MHLNITTAPRYFRCIMEMGQIFEYPSLPPIKWLVFPASPEYLQYRSETGPGICAPYLFELEWIDKPNVMGIHFSVLGLPDGNLTDSIFPKPGGSPSCRVEANCYNDYFFLDRGR